MTDAELIREVAEKVMGWNILNNTMSDGHYLFYGQVFIKPQHPFNPLTNLNHAICLAALKTEEK